MCRKSQLQGSCLVAFGLGLLVGQYLESWFLCCAGGLGLMLLGFMILRRR